jgi:hypothetical protein
MHAALGSSSLLPSAAERPWPMKIYSSRCVQASICPLHGHLWPWEGCPGHALALCDLASPLARLVI